jgi:hypothetical protein
VPRLAQMPGQRALLADACFIPRVEPEGRLSNQISTGRPQSRSATAWHTKSLNFF